MTPESALEKLLAAAAADPGLRPELYGALRAGPLFVAGGALAGRTIPGPDGPVHAVFTSPARMGEAFPPGTPWVAVAGAAWFASLPAGARAVLNPLSGVGKELAPAEVAWLAGREEPGAEPFLVPRGEELLLGAPAHPPEALLSALRALFRRRPAVEAAWLGQVAFPGGAEAPHAVVGVRLSGGSFEELARDLGLVARAALPPGEIVDFLEVTGAGGALERWLLSAAEPFYGRGRSGR